MIKRILLFFVIISFSCNESNNTYKPLSSGRIHSVSVVVNSNDWNSKIGDAIRKSYADEYLGLPQIEERFSLSQIDYETFSGFARTSRNIIYINKRKTKSYSIVKNKFARPQLYLEISGTNENEIIEQVMLSKRDGIKAFTNGEYIFREGESAAYAYVIKSGVVEIVKNSASGVQVLAELKPPTIFGEMALIDGNPRSAGARAKENSVVTEVTSTAFSSYLSKNPEAAIRIMKNISENLRASNQLVAKYERADVNSTDLDSELTSLDKNTKDFEIDDTDALYERKPSKPILILVVTLLTFLLGSVLYASLSQVDTTISARGEFLTATPNIIVEASASSVVKSVEVERGDMVSKDQIIAYLDDTMVQVNLKQNEEKIDNIVQALISLYMEEFLVNNGLINFLKFRASWLQVGNAEIGNFASSGLF